MWVCELNSTAKDTGSCGHVNESAVAVESRGIL
jgi:hypothetical protein